MSENGAITWTNERRRLRDLVPWERNPREISKQEAERLGESLQEFGQIQTIAIGPENEVYDGHQRKLVWSILPQFGPDYEVDVRVSSRPLTEQERQKLVIYLHKGTVGEWDWDELANSFEVADLLDWGFDDAELLGDWGEEPTPDPGAQVDKAAELQEKWQVKRGDVWVIPSRTVEGKAHRVMCGDSTSEGDVGRLMGRERAQLFATDPPYGVAYGVETGASIKFDAIANDENDGPKLQVFLEDAFSVWLEYLEPNAAWYLWHAQMTQGFFAAAAAAAAALLIHRQIIWVKPSLILGHGDYHWRHELCFYGWVKGNRPPFYGQRNQTTVWEIERNSTGEHPTSKPPELWHAPMLNHTAVGGLCAEPFCGSGSQIVAAEQLERICYACDIEPKYVSVTLERLAGMGLEPELAETCEAVRVNA